MPTSGLTITEDGFIYRISNSKVTIVCTKVINGRELSYYYSIVAKNNRIGQVISSKNLPYENDPKRDNKITEVLEDRLGLKKEDVKRIISNLVDSFNDLPDEKIEILKTIPEKKTIVPEKPTIEKRYGVATYALAQKILADQYSFQIVRHVLDFGTAGEYQKKMLIFALSLTVLLGKPTWIITSGKSGEGKSNLLEGVFELLPENMKERMNSGKLAAIYRKSREDPYYYANKVIYFGDLGDMNEDLSKSANAELKELFSIFKQLSSEGEIRRPISIKNEESGEWESIEMTLKGRPLLMFTTTATEFDTQIQSRAFIIYPTMNSFQNSIVACFQRVENMLPASQRVPNEIAVLRQAIACAIEILGEEKIKVINPFTPALDAGISADSPNIKRDRPKIYSLVNAITLWYSKQREKFEGNAVSTVIDHFYMLHIAGESINRMLSGSGDENFPNLFKKISDRMQPLSKPLSDLKAGATSKEMEERAYALKELEEKAITNEMVKDWLVIGTSSAAALTRQAAKKGMLIVDKSAKQHKYYLPNEASRLIVKTNGHVAFGSNATLQALFSPEKLCNTLNGMCNEAYKKHIRHTHTLADLAHIKTPSYRLSDLYKIGDVCIPISIWDSQLKCKSGAFQTFSYLKEQLDVALHHNAISPSLDSEIHNEQTSQEGFEKEFSNRLDDTKPGVLQQATTLLKQNYDSFRKPSDPQDLERLKTAMINRLTLDLEDLEIESASKVVNEYCSIRGWQ